jgi:hypothetical protein
VLYTDVLIGSSKYEAWKACSVKWSKHGKIIASGGIDESDTDIFLLLMGWD